MNYSQVRALCDNIIDFKHAAVLVEAEIERLGLVSDSKEDVPKTGGRSHQDMWMSMKTVSHFNIGISLELMLKLILNLSEKPLPKRPADKHKLAILFDGIPCEFQRKLDIRY